MPRGRQYYDPIVQVPGTVEGEQDLSRIELFPEGSPEDANPKWRGRLIDAKGLVASVTSGDFNQERALEQAKQTFGEHLSVYVLRDEGQDSTWEGHGPSPRLWQRPGATPTEIPPAVPPFDLKVDQEGQEEIWRPTEEQAPLRLLVAPEPARTRCCRTSWVSSKCGLCRMRWTRTRRGRWRSVTRSTCSETSDEQRPGGRDRQRFRSRLDLHRLRLQAGGAGRVEEGDADRG